MTVYDISQPVFGCAVYPGDPAPVRTVLSAIAEGAGYNLTTFSMCAHNGTHVDAPFHFVEEGRTVDRVPLEKYVGPAYVVRHSGSVTAADAVDMLCRAHAAYPGAEKKLLIGGPATVTAEAAWAFADAGLDLVGNESQTVGPEDAPMAVHLVLLEAEVVLLEGLRLSGVPEGAYQLCCAPLNLNGADGAPCRAVLTTLPGSTRAV